MKAYLINPEAGEISAVGLSGHDNLQDYYRLIGCDTVEAVTIPSSQSHTCYVDEEGLHKPLCYFFALRGYPQPITGKGIIVRTDSSGRSVEPTLSIDQLKRDVMFITLINKNTAIVRDAQNTKRSRTLPLKTVLDALETESWLV